MQDTIKEAAGSLVIPEALKEKLAEQIKKMVIDYLDAHVPTQIPVSIFRNILSPLEALVKYMKDNLKLKYHEIAKRLHRDDRTIWITYRNSKSKYVELEISKDILIPLSIFYDRKLSILEHLVLYLREERSYSNKEIAMLLDKNESTIWTAHTRAKKKI
jgi:hypothetical protein